MGKNQNWRKWSLQKNSFYQILKTHKQITKKIKIKPISFSKVTAKYIHKELHLKKKKKQKERYKNEPCERSFWVVSLGSIEHSLSIAYISSSPWFPVISLMFWIVFRIPEGIETLANPPTIPLLLIFTTPKTTTPLIFSTLVYTPTICLSVYMYHWIYREKGRGRKQRVIYFSGEI